jgi:hypothetical protein
LLISYGNTPADATSISTTSTAAWNTRAQVVMEGAGAHVDMAVDRFDNVHLAFYDVFNGGLYYAYIPGTAFTRTTSTNSTTANGQGAQILSANIAVVKVDTYLSAGTKLMINVREEFNGDTAPTANTVIRPYISYFHASFNETRNSVRVAWPVNYIRSLTDVKPGTDAVDRFTGNWEVMTVPAANLPLGEFFICNGVPRTNGNWTPPSGANQLIGFNNGDNTQTGSLVHRSILVGYMTDTRYEGASLKYHIWQ